MHVILLLSPIFLIVINVYLSSTTDYLSPLCEFAMAGVRIFLLS